SAPDLLDLDASRLNGLQREGQWRTTPEARGRFGTPRTGAAALALWLAAVLVIGLLMMPACVALLPRAWSRGVLAAPALGLTWAGWVVWMWGSVTPWPVSHGVIVAAVLSPGLLS